MKPALSVLAVVACVLAAACGGETTTVTQTQTVTVTETETGGSAEPVDCHLPPPDGAGYFDLFATNTDCETANSVLAEWQDQCQGQESPNCSLASGFECSYEDQGIELGQIRCIRDDATVTFKVGA